MNDLELVDNRTPEWVLDHYCEPLESDEPDSNTSKLARSAIRLANLWAPTRKLASAGLLVLHLQKFAGRLLNQTSEHAPNFTKTFLTVSALALQIFCPVTYSAGITLFSIVKILRSEERNEKKFLLLLSEAVYFVARLVSPDPINSKLAWVAVSLIAKTIQDLFSPEDSLSLLFNLFRAARTAHILQQQPFAFPDFFRAGVNALEITVIRAELTNIPPAIIALWGTIATVALTASWMTRSSPSPVESEESDEEQPSFLYYPTETLDSVVGCEKPKAAIRQILDMKKNPEHYASYGVRSPKGLLFHGEPGTGKTLMAKAMGGELGLPLLYFSGSELKSKWVEESAGFVRAIFYLARINTPCILFIDEIDAIAGPRGSADTDDKQITEAFLTAMDQLPPGVIVVGTSNCDPSEMDSAFVRAGRFDWKIEFSLPTLQERKAYFEAIKSRYPLDPDLCEKEIETLCKEAHGTSFADLESICNNTALEAAQKHAPFLTFDLFLAAIARFQEPKKRDAVYPTESLDDVIGCQESKKIVRRILDMKLNPEHYARFGVSAPKGVLFYGSPGTGKTLVAKAMARELGQPLFYVNSTELISKWWGDSAKNIRALFKKAQESQPCIILLDEIDFLSSRQDREALEAFLTEMDRLPPGVLIIGTTNFPPEDLDPAMVRSGRFDRKIEFSYPTSEERGEFFRLKQDKVPIDPAITDPEIEKFSKKIGGTSFADLQEIFQGAGLMAAERREELLDLERLLESYEQVRASKKRDALYPTEKLDSVVGCEKAKEAAKLILDMRKNPERYARFGISPPKGLFFYGPPGTGKTLIAKSIAGELELPLYYVSAPTLASKWIGEGAKNVHELFQKAKDSAPCILFIDEIDSIVSKRAHVQDYGASLERNRMVEAFLVAMDQLPPGVVVIGASNFKPEALDDAVVRSGRFDHKIEFALPTPTEREAYFRFAFKKYPVDPMILEKEIREFSRLTDGLSFADLEAILGSAGLSAAEQDLPHLNRQVLLTSIKRFNEAKKKPQ